MNENRTFVPIPLDPWGPGALYPNQKYGTDKDRPKESPPVVEFVAVAGREEDAREISFRLAHYVRREIFEHISDLVRGRDALSLVEPVRVWTTIGAGYNVVLVVYPDGGAPFPTLVVTLTIVARSGEWKIAHSETLALPSLAVEDAPGV